MAFQLGADPEIEVVSKIARNSAEPWLTVNHPSNEGVGWDCGALELRYTRGFRTPNNFEHDTEYWITSFCDANTNLIDAYEISLMGGNGREQPLGGHLHSTFSLPIFKGYDNSYDNSRDELSFSSKRTLQRLLSLVVIPVFLSEESAVNSAQRRSNYSYGKPFTTKIHSHHIEWRMPFCWLHSKELTKGVMGIWGWWTNIVNAIAQKQISFEGALTKANPLDTPTMILSDKMSRGIAVNKHKEYQAELRQVFLENINIYRQINSKIFERWAPYFLPMFEAIADEKKYAEDINILDIWYKGSSIRKKPDRNKKCKICKRDGIDVSDISIHGSGIVCLSCSTSMRCDVCGKLSISIKTKFGIMLCGKCAIDAFIECPKCASTILKKDKKSHKCHFCELCNAWHIE